MADPFPRAGVPPFDLGLPGFDWLSSGFVTPLPGIAELIAATNGMGPFLPASPLWKPIKVELPVDPPQPPPEPARPKLDPAEIEWKRQDLILVGQIIDTLLNWEQEVFFHIRGEVVARTKIRLFDDEAPSPVATDYHPSQSVSAPVDAETQAYWDEQNRQYALRAEARRAAAASDPAPSQTTQAGPAAAVPNPYLRRPDESFETWQHRLFDAFGATQALIGQQQPAAALAELAQLKAAIEADPDFQRDANAYAQSIDPAFYADPAVWVQAHGLPASALKEIPWDQAAIVYPEDADPIAAFIQSNGNQFVKIASNGKIYDIGDILTSPARHDFLKPPPPIASIYNHASLELAERAPDPGDTLIDAVTTAPALGIGEGGGSPPIFVPPRLRAAEGPEPERPQPKLPGSNSEEIRGPVGDIVKQRIRLQTFDEYKLASSQETLPPNTIYEYDGREFETDFMGRSVVTRGKVNTAGARQRMPSVDRAIGQSPDAQEGDVGFHRGGDALGFPGGKLNVNPGNGVPDPVNFPNTPNLNQGAYKQLENKLAALDGQGKTVHVEFEAVFNEGNLTQRPDAFNVKYTVDGGEPEMTEFYNQPGG